MVDARFLMCCIGLLFFAAASAQSGLPSEADEVNVRLVPDNIEVGVFYHGAEVQVTADVQPCDAAVLVVEEGNDEVTFNRKGRKAGIWLNVAKLTVGGLPRVYLLGSSMELDRICPESTQLQLNLGKASLQERMTLESDLPLVGNEADEFFRLKTENGTYKLDIAVDLTPAEGGRQTLTAELPIPATVPPGAYHVTLYCFENDTLTQRGTAEFSIRRIGLVSLLASLAYEHAALYGVLAILVAVIVGVAMGTIFHSLPGSEH